MFHGGAGGLVTACDHGLRHPFAEGRLALTFASSVRDLHGLKLGIVVAIVIGFAVGFTSPGHRILKAIGIKTACATSDCGGQ
jgi:ABC-type nitrate/sulfonate/bicarbonate transport system permease component